MKRRYKLKNKKRFVFVILLFMMSILLLISSFNVDAENEKQYIQITVRKGDTLWGIAKNYSKDLDIRKYIFKIKKINGMKNSLIYEGQILRLPQ